MSEPVDSGEPYNWTPEQPAAPPLEPVLLPVEPADGILVEREELPEVTPIKRGHPIVAWLAIIAIVVAVPFLRGLRTSEEQSANQKDRLSLLVLKMQSKFFLGASEFARASDPNAAKSLAEKAVALNTGPLDQRLCYVVLVGDLAGFEYAEKELKELDKKIANSDHVQDTQALEAKDSLERLYADYAAGKLAGPSVDEEDRANLHATLGWFADLAFARPGGANAEARKALLGSAQATFVVFMVVLVLGGLACFAGFIGLCSLVGYSLSGNLKAAVVTGGGQGGIYAETFALWMFVFLLFGWIASLVVQKVHLEGLEMLVAGFATLASLVVLAWPVARGGIPWRQVRKDIGLVPGPRPILEPLLGPVGYAMSLPLLAIGVLMTLFLVTMQGALGSVWGSMAPADEFSPAGFPAHPIIEFLAGPDWWGKFQVLFLGSVVAPIVEETMFRGVLYRHMRESTRRWPFFLGFASSALVVSFVFAVIHPQGIVAVPALMSLAVGFTIMREWRGSLISCMIAHGLNNALVMSLATFVFSG